jgi:hypothetical protein
MHPTLERQVMKARQYDKMPSAAEQRMAAQARKVRLARRVQTAAEPRRRVRRLVWRVLPG